MSGFTSLIVLRRREPSFALRILSVAVFEINFDGQSWPEMERCVAADHGAGVYWRRFAGPPEKIQSKTKMEERHEEYALADGRFLFGGIADARNGKGPESV